MVFYDTLDLFCSDLGCFIIGEMYKVNSWISKLVSYHTNWNW